MSGSDRRCVDLSNEYTISVSVLSIRFSSFWVLVGGGRGRFRVCLDRLSESRGAIDFLDNPEAAHDDGGHAEHESGDGPEDEFSH